MVRLIFPKATVNAGKSSVYMLFPAVSEIIVVLMAAYPGVTSFGSSPDFLIG
jgi:hypothetical protein